MRSTYITGYARGQTGVSTRDPLICPQGACGVAAGLSLPSSVAQDQYKGVILIVFCAAAWIGVQHLGYVEFGVAGRMVVGGAFRRHLNDQIALQAFEEEMAAAETLDGARFEEKLVETNGNPAWRVEIPLEGEGHLVLTRCFGEEQAPTVLAPFAEAVRRGLGVRPTSTAAVAQPRPNGSERRSAAAGA